MNSNITHLKFFDFNTLKKIAFEGDRQTDTQTNRHTDKQTHRQTDTQTSRLLDQIGPVGRFGENQKILILSSRGPPRLRSAVDIATRWRYRLPIKKSVTTI